MIGENGELLRHDADTKSAVGRPRSEAAHKAILKAVVELIAEGGSLANLSMDAVAARAGVGKATIYRRWPNKEELLLGALGATARALPKLPGRSVREDLLLMLRGMADPRINVMPQIFNARCYAALLVEGADNPDFMRRYKLEIIEPRRQMFRAIVERAIASGEIRADVDPEILREMLVSPLIQRLLRLQPGEHVPLSFIEMLVDTALRGALAPSRP